MKGGGPPPLLLPSPPDVPLSPDRRAVGPVPFHSVPDPRQPTSPRWRGQRSRSFVTTGAGRFDELADSTVGGSSATSGWVAHLPGAPT